MYSLVFAGITVLKFMSFWYRKMLCYSICPTVLAIVSVINFSLTGLQLDPLNVFIISTNQICVFNIVLNLIISLIISG